MFSLLSTNKYQRTGSWVTRFDPVQSFFSTIAGTMQLYNLGLLVGSFVASVGATSTFSPARPPAVPLAVKSPYLSTWLDVGSDGGDGGYLAGEWPTFWE